MLNLLDGVDLAALGHNTPAYLHRVVESIKLAFADRDAFYGDPNFVNVPAERLLSKAYAAERRRLVTDRAIPEMPPAGDLGPRPPAPRRVAEVAGGSDALDTSYVAVVDAEGNAFSATPSDPNVDSPAVPGLGCVVSPRGSQGWLDDAHASVVAPGKRPRLTPAPAMAFADGRAFMPFGTPGGDVQQQAMLQVDRHRGAARGLAQLPRLVLAARVLAGQARGRGPHSEGDDRRAGRARPRGLDVAGLGMARRRSVRGGGRSRGHALGWRRPAPGGAVDRELAIHRGLKGH
jgi:hypothetical protein